MANLEQPPGFSFQIIGNPTSNIKVARSNGNIEDNWDYIHKIRHSETFGCPVIRVIKYMNKSEYMCKDVKLPELYKNNTTLFKNGVKLEYGQNSSEMKDYINGLGIKVTMVLSNGDDDSDEFYT